LQKNTYILRKIKSNTNCYTNKSPYCTERKVCGVATSALIDKLVDTDFKIDVNDENNIIVDNLQISADEIRKTHEQNILYAREYQNQQETVTLNHLSKKITNIR
jgi:hypothetical protein